MKISSLEELERVRSRCYKMVTKRSAVSAATAAIPFGLAGAASDVYNLGTLLPKINKAFGLDPE
jgi:hypothetical protein